VVSDSLEREVRQRAAGVCEYCRFPERVHAYPFHIEHVIARQHGGASTLDNLALACNLCNLHKGPNMAGFDPETGKLVPLFNPRKDSWTDHFRRDGAEIRALIPIARVMVQLLNMNDPTRVEVRRMCIAAGLMTP
jgi:hypothetical protein